MSSMEEEETESNTDLVSELGIALQMTDMLEYRLGKLALKLHECIFRPIVAVENGELKVSAHLIKL